MVSTSANNTNLAHSEMIAATRELMAEIKNNKQLLLDSMHTHNLELVAQLQLQNEQLDGKMRALQQRIDEVANESNMVFHKVSGHEGRFNHLDEVTGRGEKKIELAGQMLQILKDKMAGL